MEELKINKTILKYVGIPLVAYVYDGSWAGRSNFLASNEKVKTDIQLKNLDDCFYWLKIWSFEKNYCYGYVLDYDTKTIYYDNEESLNHLIKTVFPRREQEGYFVNFIQKNFSF